MNMKEINIDNPSEEIIREQLGSTLNLVRKEIGESESFLLTTSKLGNNSRSIIFATSNKHILVIYKNLVEEAIPILESKLKESGMTSDMIENYVNFPKNKQF